MTYRIIVEPSAVREIRSAVHWKTENVSPTVAVRWYNGLIKKIETLHRLPTRCPLAAENDRFPEDIRKPMYGRDKCHKHRILFTIRDDAVHILFVRHGARNELVGRATMHVLSLLLRKPFSSVRIDQSLPSHYFKDTGMQWEANAWRTVGLAASGDAPTCSSLKE